MMKNVTKDEAIKYCFDLVKPSYFEDQKEYAKYKLLRYRHLNGTPIKENAIKSLFDRLGVKEVCTYQIPNNED